MNTIRSQPLLKKNRNFHDIFGDLIMLIEGHLRGKQTTDLNGY